jgi:hypothetical protein
MIRIPQDKINSSAETEKVATATSDGNTSDAAEKLSPVQFDGRNVIRLPARKQLAKSNTPELSTTPLTQRRVHLQEAISQGNIRSRLAKEIEKINGGSSVENAVLDELDLFKKIPISGRDKLRETFLFAPVVTLVKRQVREALQELSKSKLAGESTPTLLRALARSHLLRLYFKDAPERNEIRPPMPRFAKRYEQDAHSKLSQLADQWDSPLQEVPLEDRKDSRSIPQLKNSLHESLALILQAEGIRRVQPKTIEESQLRRFLAQQTRETLIKHRDRLANSISLRDRNENVYSKEVMDQIVRFLIAIRGTLENLPI